jgi:hypothetical protein
VVDEKMGWVEAVLLIELVFLVATAIVAGWGVVR